MIPSFGRHIWQLQAETVSWSAHGASLGKLLWPLLQQNNKRVLVRTDEDPGK
jgi:hypothetical protein